MPLLNKIIIISISTFVTTVSHAHNHHPDRTKIDSLKKELLSAHGTDRINCLNALAEEFWWWQYDSHVADSVARWAMPANAEAQKINYTVGWATSLMHIGVSEIYRKNFLIGEKYLSEALRLFETLNNDKGVGWCNVWLGQDLFSQMEFKRSLDCYYKSLSYFDRTNDWEGKGKAWAWLGSLYTTIGDYDKGVFFAGQSLSIRKQISDYMCVARSLSSLGNFYKAVGANEEALSYFQQAMVYANEHSLDYRLAERNFLFESLGSFYGTLNKPDSSLFFLQQALQADPANLMTQITVGETLLLKQKYDSALQIFLRPIEPFRTQNNKWDLMRVLLDAAQAYAGKGNNVSALGYAYESLSIARATNVKPFIMKNYVLLSTLHANLFRSDSAYYYLKLSTALNNDLTNGRFLFRLSNYKKQTEFNKQLEEIASLDKNNKLLDQANRIKAEKLKQASLLKWVFATGLLIALLAALFVYRSLSLKRKNEQLENQKAQSDLKLRASELEMQALRAQMNPHFIFNCLSSINHFILKNETEPASDYLTKFSRLIRIVLINSKNKLITLEDELEMLRLYLDMERLRFKNSFSYHINFTNSVDSDNIYIPPLLLQPFAENAIWHGLMNKEGEGCLEIRLSMENNFLICSITDNGIGRKAAAELRAFGEKKKSLGLKITNDRLAVINENNQDKASFEFEDLYDEHGVAAGTRVILKISTREHLTFPQRV